MPDDFQVDGWLVQPSRNRVSRGSRVVRLEPKVMQVLEALAERPGRVVSRDELVGRVWAGVHVTDDVVHRAIRELRRAFADEASHPRVIETIRKRGYRLMLDAAPVASTEAGHQRAASRGHEAAAWPTIDAGVPARPRPHSTPVRLAGWSAAILALVAPLVASLASRVPSMDAVTFGRIALVAAGPGNEAEPALSADGARLAYVVRALPGSGMPSQVFVANADGSDPRQVTSAQAEHRTPAWSPDGRTLVLSRHGDAGTCRLVQVDPATADEWPVSACPNPFETRVDWAADDTLYVSARAGSEERSPLVIARLSLGDGRIEPVTSPPPGVAGDHSPRVAPDGRTLAFIRAFSASMSDLYVMPVAGGAPTRLTFDAAAISGYDWSPDGGSLVVSSERAGSYTLWSVPAAGGTPRFVAGGAARLKHPVVSRRDGRILYESWSYDINLWDTSGAREADGRPLTIAADAWDFGPALSPDGSRLAFVSTRSGFYEVWLAGRDGASPRPLTSFRAGHVSGLRWSPDGSRLVARVERRGHVDLHVIDADGRTRALTDDAVNEVAPAWSRDGRAVYFGARDQDGWQIWRMDLESGDRWRVVRGYAAQETPDGRAIVMTRAEEPGLWRHTLGGVSTALVTSAYPRGAPANWKVEEDGVYVLGWASRGEGATAGVTPLVVRLGWDGVETPVARVPDLAWAGFALTPDRRGVVYARASRRDSNLLAIARAP